MFDSFKSFAQNIDSGYTLEPPQRAVLMSTHNLCFGAKIRNEIPVRKINTPIYPIFTI